MTPVFNRFARFVVVGADVFPINVGLTALLHEVLHLPEEAAFAIALATVFVVGFFANRHLVFAAGAGRIRPQMVRYVVAAVGFRIVQFASFLVIHSWLGAPYLFAVVAVLSFWLVVKFVVFRALVFKSS